MSDEGFEQLVRIDDTGRPDDPYEDFLAEGSTDPLATRRLEDEAEPISINYTSGTTGRPKGAVYHHRGAYLNALGEVIETQLTPSSVYLWTLPMFHCNGWCFTWAVTAVGGRHVCLRTVDSGRIWEVFDAEGITHYNGAPTVQASLLDDENAHKLDRAVVTTVSGRRRRPSCSAGSPRSGSGRSTSTVRPSSTGHTRSASARRGYGTSCRPTSRHGYSVAQGVHYVIAEPVRVVDEQGEEVAADGETLGEVLMRGNNVMTGYFEDPEQTEETLAGGWSGWGDLAVRHPDGYIELRDRKKDIIVSGGENMPTIEVEHAVSEHPAVAAAAVVSMPDRRVGGDDEGVRRADRWRAGFRGGDPGPRQGAPSRIHAPGRGGDCRASPNIHRQDPKEGATPTASGKARGAGNRLVRSSPGTGREGERDEQRLLDQGEGCKDLQTRSQK